MRGMLRAIFMEGAALQLVALQIHAVGNRRIQGRLTEPVRQALADARRRLLADVANPPTLRMLATEVGRSSKALNTGFRRLYGETVFEVLRNERLELARIALESNAASIKVIAHRVGYTHVANFNAAFARRYGAPPLRYRNERNSRGLKVND
jgi:AraC-like DNA-binding protein